MTDEDDFWSNDFHHCALAAGFLAASVGRLGESRYVQQLAYELYERGTVEGQTVTNWLTTLQNRVNEGSIVTTNESSHDPQAQENQTDRSRD